MLHDRILNGLRQNVSTDTYHIPDTVYHATLLITSRAETKKKACEERNTHYADSRAQLIPQLILLCPQHKCHQPSHSVAESA